ncbi:MAG: BatA domain-containing protein [Planctomycetota bacterium]
MNYLPTFSAWQFAAAGAVCASGPIIIHLLNLRRPRQVHWAAMDFLREALQRHRRLIQIRDLLLLLLRVLAVVLFGFALARPYFAANSSQFDGTQPLHAVLLIDNSLSMGYQSTAGTLLDEARARAREFIDRLPRGSQISVIPLCGSARGMTVDPYFAKEDAAEALNRIEVVDRGVSLRASLNLARKACEASPELAKRLVLIGDQQGQNWVDVDQAALAELPPIQIVTIAATRPENTWIESLRVGGDVAALNLETSIVAEVRHSGDGPRRDLPVTLWVDGRPVATQTVTVPPSEGARQVVFQHVFADYQPEPDRPVYVPIHVALAPDQLPEDDQRFGVVPVVAELPVVFVDQYADDEEDRTLRRFGETRWLRTLLSDATRPDPSLPSLVKVRHVRIDRLSRDELADARLVIVAGVKNPADKVDLLREYVQQGGQLIVAAGGDFDPSAWSEAAWRGGDGILPGPLQREPLGTLPELATGTLNPFQFIFETLREEYFGLPSVSPDELRDLYDEPLFFQVVDLDLRDEVLGSLRAAEQRWLEEQANAADGDNSNDIAGATGSGKPGNGPDGKTSGVKAANKDAMNATTQSGSRDGDNTLGGSAGKADEQLEWLRWRSSVGAAPAITGATPEERKQAIEKAAELRLPRVLARVSSPNRAPLLVDRRIGHGRVVFMASGVFSGWNTLPDSSAMFVFERLSREMIATTLPPAQFATLESIKVPLTDVEPDSRVELFRPDQPGRPTPVDFGFIDQQRRGVTLANGLTRGIYRVAVRSENAAAAESFKADGEKKNGENGKDGDGGEIKKNGVDSVAKAAGGDQTSGGQGSGEASDASLRALEGATRVIPLALNGPARESDLAPLTADKQETLEANESLRWLSGGEAISLEGAQLRGQGSWWYLALAVLLALIGELVILARMTAARAVQAT